jgi:TM2 domain-containing membrane protein YozV
MNDQRYFSHPGIAAVLSFLFTGLGQIYNGQIKKGLIIMFFSSVAMILTILGAIVIGCWILGKFNFFILLILGIGLFLIGLSLICILGIFSIVDAFKEAQKRIT